MRTSASFAHSIKIGKAPLNGRYQLSPHPSNPVKSAFAILQSVCPSTRIEKYELAEHQRGRGRPDTSTYTKSRQEFAALIKSHRGEVKALILLLSLPL